MSLAWHTAALPRTERFPDLSSLLIAPPPRVVVPQSEDESWNMFAALKARMENQ
jgi:hypothetical protein